MQPIRCLKCMKETDRDPCPYCGFSLSAAPAEGSAMKRGTILNDRYLIGCLLGRGGFGMTYAAYDQDLGQKVAIKEYFPHGFARRSSDGVGIDWASDDMAMQLRDSGIESVLKEARKMAVVTNVPEIVRVLHVFSENDTAYIVMEFVAGVTLQTLLDKKGPLSWAKTERIFSAAIRAMASIHSCGLVHRDLSPDNLMIMPNGSVRILDMGAAKDLNRNPGVSSVLVVKNGFSPMEQYLERGHSGPWTDVYSMAATICYTLTMVVPQDAMARMYDDQLDLTGSPYSEMPAQAVEALRHALAVRYADRTSNMNTFAQELFGRPSEAPRSVREEPTAARLPQESGRQEKPARPSSREKTSEKSVRRRRKKHSRLVPLLILLLILALAAAAFCLWRVLC